MVSFIGVCRKTKNFVFMQTDFFAFQFALELIIDLTFKYAKQTNLFSRGFMELSVD